MSKEELIRAAKQNRKDLDGVLQQVKELKSAVVGANPDDCEDKSEAIANTQLAIRDAESAIMRLGMVLKHIGNPNPYPESYNPDSTKVEPTADGLKL
jgi:predicted nucleotide-binding protein